MPQSFADRYKSIKPAPPTSSKPPRLSRPANPAAWRKPAPHERGLLGAASDAIVRGYTRAKASLFGRRAAVPGWTRTRLRHRLDQIRPVLHKIAPLGRRAVRQLRRRKPVTRRARYVAGAAGLLTLAAVAYSFSGQKQTAGEAPQAAASTVIPAPPPDELPKGTPDYVTLTPDDKDIRELGGWTRVSPPDRDPVYAFTDQVGEIPLTISQQPLPADFKADTNAQVAQLAKSFKATKKLDVKGSPAYIGASAKGPQSAITSRNDLLILIKSTAPLTDQQWLDYLASLR